MEVLVIGVSSVFVRRVLPALIELDSVQKIHLASQKENISVDLPKGKRGNFFHGYMTAINSLRPCLAYVSLPNHLHYVWSKALLEAGFHVIVDKPAFLSLASAKELTELAACKNVCLAESTVWDYDPKINHVKDVLKETGFEVENVQSTFTFPSLAVDNFRNDPKRGGGCFNDLCAYAITPGRVFFGGLPDDLDCKVHMYDATNGIDTSFSFHSYYPSGRSLQGFFAFGLEYRNSMRLVGSKIAIDINPAFTSQEGKSSTISISKMGVTKEIIINYESGFKNFFNAVIESIQNGNYVFWSKRLLDDAIVIELAAKSAGVNRNGN